jgi:type II secretion system protein C
VHRPALRINPIYLFYIFNISDRIIVRIDSDSYHKRLASNKQKKPKMFEFSGILFRLTQSKNAVYLVNGILALLIALSAVYWVRLYMNRDYRLLLESSQISSPASAGVGINPDELISYHLFGAAPVSTPVSNEIIPLSSLNLKLTGVVASDRGGFALISVNGQPQSPFFIGEVVTRDAVLDQVLPDRVILLRGNTRESLLLDNDEQNSLSRNQARTPAPSPATAANPANSIQNVGENNYVLPRKVVAQNINNMDVLKQALIVPNKDGGFLVKDVQKNGVFDKLGLQKGDVIHKVNHLAVNSMVDVMQLYRLTNDINKVNSIQVEISRGGNDEILYYRLE